MNYAAGIILMAKSGRVLLLKRGPGADHAGEWSTPGGGIEGEESAADAAVREVLEETGYRVGSAGQQIATRIAEDVHYTSFLQQCDDEFVPVLNDENVAWAWVTPEDVLAEQPPYLPSLISPPTTSTLQ